MSSSQIHRAELHRILNGANAAGASAEEIPLKSALPKGMGDVRDELMSAMDDLHLPPERSKASQEAEIIESDSYQDEESKLFNLSITHQKYVTQFITDFHGIVIQNNWVQLPLPVRLANFFRENKSELLQKRKEKLSYLAALKFLHASEELKQRVIESFYSLNALSWISIKTFVYSIYNQSFEARVRVEIDTFCIHDPIAKEKGWKSDIIMSHITENNLQELIRYMFLIET